MTVNLLSDLPAELLLRVGEQLPSADCCSLSSVNSQFRRFLLPLLFQGLRANNRYEHSETLQRLVPNIVRYVQRLSFDLYMNEDEEFFPRDENRKGERTFKVEDTPPIIWDLLSRRALPNCSTLRVKFCPLPEDFEGMGWNDDGCGGGINLGMDIEDLEHVAEMERDYPWRELFSKALETIARGSGKLHRLEVLNLPPKSATAQLTDEWKAMLGGLEEVELSLWGGDNGVGWHANTMQGYLDSIEALESTFFEHLKSAKRVKLAAHEDNPIGCPGWRQCPIPFGRRQMPQIEHLELQDCFVDLDLMAFLNNLPGQLQSIRLINCYSAGNDEHRGIASIATPWNEFLSCVRKSQPSLVEFVIEERRTPPLTHDEQFVRPEDMPFVPPENEPDDVKRVRGVLRDDPGRRLFAYTCLDDKYGMVFAYDDVNVQMFLEGDDQREYDALMEVVEGNQRKDG